MGPSIILDKSAFQMLSAREQSELVRYFMHNITPVLRYEVLGDLSKKITKGRGARERVMELAGKLSGLGSYFNENYQNILAMTLLGAEAELDGRPLAENQSVRGDAILIDSTRLSLQLLAWAGGNFSESDEKTSRMWREVTRGLSLNGLNDVLNRHRVLLPTPTGPDTIVATADELLATTSLQPIWLEWLFQQNAFSPSAKQAIRARAEEAHHLSDVSEYAHHCVRVLLSLAIAVRHRFLKWDPTHLVDVQYLYYLPFCMIFSSEDHVHRLLAPQLLMQKVQFEWAPQTFVLAQDLKRGLRELADDRDALDSRQRARRDFALGSYPPPVGTGLVNRLWKQHHGSWPGSGNRAVKLSPEEAALALDEARRLVGADSS